MWKSNVKNVLQDKHLANAIQQTSGLYKVVNGAMSEYMCQMFERDLSAANNVTDLLSTTHADNTNALFGFAYFRHTQQVKCQRVRKACNRTALLALHASGCHLERPLLVGVARSCHSYTAPTCIDQKWTSKCCCTEIDKLAGTARPMATLALNDLPHTPARHLDRYG